jgi:ribosome-associated translation inhibitor RaiA
VSTSERTPIALPDLPAVVELSGSIAPDLVEYLQQKIAVVLAHTGRAAVHAHVRVVRHADPARERPVTARASVRLAGVAVHAHADGATPREAADLLVDRLDQRIARVSRTRRGDRCAHTSVPPVAVDSDNATQEDADPGAPTTDRREDG